MVRVPLFPAVPGRRLTSNSPADPRRRSSAVIAYSGHSNYAIMQQHHRPDAMLEMYSRFIKPGDLAYDIGANHGDREEAFLRLGASVVAVEPQPHCLDELRTKYAERSDVVILGAAVDAVNGRARMVLSNNDMVSSLNPDWIAKVKAGGRFDDSEWDREMDVRTITLDCLIEDYGLPAFIKIDVEGNELRVLQGLHHAVAALSFEYTPEDIVTAVRCVRRLEELGDYRFDLSPGESMAMKMDRYVPGNIIIEELTKMAARGDDVVSGDVYAVRYG